MLRFRFQHIRAAGVELLRGSATRVGSAEMNHKVEHRQLYTQPK
jgi:hypothetical protein